MVEDVPQALADWRGRLVDALLDSALVGVEPFQSLLQELDSLLIAVREDHQTHNSFTLKELHPIDRYGCAIVVTKLYEQGVSSAEISHNLSQYFGEPITPAQVDQWINDYKSSTPTQRQQRSNQSIFDTTNRLESIYTELLGIVTRIEGEDDEVFARAKRTRWDVLLEAQREMRSLTKDAANIIKTMQELNAAQEFCRVAIEEIGKVSPQTQRAIWGRLRDKRALLQAMGL